MQKRKIKDVKNNVKANRKISIIQEKRGED